MNKEKELLFGGYELVFPAGHDTVLAGEAVCLINHYYKEGLMLPVTREQYTDLAQKGALIVAKKPDGHVIGTAAYTQFYDRNIWEFGGWAVDENYQHQGIGLKLLKALFTKRLHFQTIAFGNKNSSPILESLGGKIIKDHSILPKEAFDLCKTCPRKPAAGCCDTIYNLSPVVEALGMTENISQMSTRQINRLVYGLGYSSQWDKFKGFGKDPEEWE